MDFLRDPIWQFVGVAIAVIALGFTIIISFRQQNKKEILFEIISDTSLSSFKLSNKVKMSILYSGRHLTDVHLIYLKIWNNGNVEIAPSDYIDPIVVSFGTDEKILEALLLKTEPPNIKDSLDIQLYTHKLILAPTLLNSKDYILLKILLSKFSGEIHVNARIKGVKQIQNLTETNLPSTGYVKSFGWGIKEILSSPFSRFIIISTLITNITAPIILPILNNSFGERNIDRIFVYGQILLFPFMTGFIIYWIGHIGLRKRKVRYNVWILFLISFLPSLALLAYIIYGLFFSHP